MSKDGMKKAAVALIVLIMGLLIGVQILIFTVLAMHIWVLFIFAAVDLIILIALIYVALQRIKEIDEGMDDDINNY